MVCTGLWFVRSAPISVIAGGLCLGGYGQSTARLCAESCRLCRKLLSLHHYLHMMILSHVDCWLGVSYPYTGDFMLHRLVPDRSHSADHIDARLPKLPALTLYIYCKYLARRLGILIIGNRRIRYGGLVYPLRCIPLPRAHSRMFSLCWQPNTTL